MRLLAAAGGLLLLGAALFHLHAARGSVAPVVWPKLPDPQFPLMLSADRRYLVDGAGAAFLIRGDAAWSLIAQLTPAEVEQYLADRKQRGFNLLKVNLLEHRFSDQPPRNAAGEAPFLADGDFTQPNEAYFAHADWVLHRAGEMGFAVLLCPAYLGFDGGQDGWFQELQKSGEGALTRYGRYVGARYRTFANIVWLEGGDFTPPLAKLRLVNALASGIREADPEHLHAAHWGPETSGAELPTGDWLDLNTTYTYLPVYLHSLIDYARADGKPHFLIESAYEDEYGSNPRSLRGQVYYALLTGAAGDIFGQRWVWKFKKGGLWRELVGRSWHSALDTPGTRGIGHARALFVKRAWTQLVPDVQGSVLVGGQGLKGSNDYAVAATSNDRRLTIVYVPSQRRLAIDTGSLSLPLRARWYDPSSGTWREAEPARLRDPGVVHLSTPGDNHGHDTDWVLVLESDERT